MAEESRNPQPELTSASSKEITSQLKSDPSSKEILTHQPAATGEAEPTLIDLCKKIAKEKWDDFEGKVIIFLNPGDEKKDKKEEASSAPLIDEEIYSLAKKKDKKVEIHVLDTGSQTKKKDDESMIQDDDQMPATVDSGTAPHPDMANNTLADASTDDDQGAAALLVPQNNTVTQAPPPAEASDGSVVKHLPDHASISSSRKSWKWRSKKKDKNGPVGSVIHFPRKKTSSRRANQADVEEKNKKEEDGGDELIPAAANSDAALHEVASAPAPPDGATLSASRAVTQAPPVEASTATDGCVADFPDASAGSSRRSWRKKKDSGSVRSSSSVFRFLKNKNKKAARPEVHEDQTREQKEVEDGCGAGEQITAAANSDAAPHEVASNTVTDAPQGAATLSTSEPVAHAPSDANDESSRSWKMKEDNCLVGSIDSRKKTTAIIDGDKTEEQNEEEDGGVEQSLAAASPHQMVGSTVAHALSGVLATLSAGSTVAQAPPAIEASAKTEQHSEKEEDCGAEKSLAAAAPNQMASNPVSHALSGVLATLSTGSTVAQAPPAIEASAKTEQQSEKEKDCGAEQSLAAAAPHQVASNTVADALSGVLATLSAGSTVTQAPPVEASATSDGSVANFQDASVSSSKRSWRKKKHSSSTTGAVKNKTTHIVDEDKPEEEQKEEEVHDDRQIPAATNSGAAHDPSGVVSNTVTTPSPPGVDTLSTSSTDAQAPPLEESATGDGSVANFQDASVCSSKRSWRKKKNNGYLARHSLRKKKGKEEAGFIGEEARDDEQRTPAASDLGAGINEEARDDEQNPAAGPNSGAVPNDMASNTVAHALPVVAMAPPPPSDTVTDTPPIVPAYLHEVDPVEESKAILKERDAALHEAQNLKNVIQAMSTAIMGAPE